MFEIQRSEIAPFDNINVEDQSASEWVKSCLSAYLTAVFFETGAMPVPTKSRNPTICGSGDPFHSYLTHS